MTLIIIKLNGLWRMLENQFSISKTDKEEGSFHPAFPMRTSKNFQELRWKRGQSISFKKYSKLYTKSHDATRISTFYTPYSKLSISALHINRSDLTERKMTRPPMPPRE